MRRPWTGRRSLSHGKSLSSDHTYPRRLIIASGLVLGSSYLATSIPTTFALDRPLHTVATVLLLSGLAIVAYETHAAKTRRPQNPSDRYVAIPLQQGNRRPSSEDLWSAEERPFHHHHALSPRALAVLLAALLCLLGARIAVFHAVIKDVECAGPQLTVRARIPHAQSCFPNSYRHSFRSCSPSTMPSLLLMTVLCPRRQSISTDSCTSSCTAPLATSFPRFCWPSVASSSPYGPVS